MEIPRMAGHARIWPPEPCHYCGKQTIAAFMIDGQKTPVCWSYELEQSILAAFDALDKANEP